MAIEQKEHDFLLNTLQNPSLSLADFDQLGLNANNTSLLDENTYKRSKQITENTLFQNNQGQFDDNKFHQYYQAMKQQYNVFSTNQFSKDLASQTWYDPDDIFAPKNGRKLSKQDMMSYTLTPNPLRLTSSMYEFGKNGPQLMSDHEIAQSQKVLANPVEYAKGAKPIWQDAPEDSFFGHFFETRVLAQWDEDGEHVDLMTGQKVQHKKGDMKLNENGTYFYENLEGRDVYGRQVLNKLNTVTKEGTTLNKWDFFDSDDLKQKSTTGTLMKNLALVGSMFLPYVGPAVAGVSVATQMVGLFGTLGKMLIDADNPVFSEMEGWSKSVNRQTLTTQYALEHPWCWENFINLVGDVAGQLKEQRFLFEYAPALFKGGDLVSWKKGIDVAKQEKKIAELEKMFKLQNETKFAELQGKAVQGMAKQNFNMMEDAAKGLQELNTKAFYDARRVVDESMKSYQKVGEILSKAYMTGITVGDTYGEAIQLGASPLEAAMLTIGYAAGEYALLNTGVGEWILPELKDSGLKAKAIARALTKGATTEHGGALGNALTKAANETKQSWAKRVFKVGADLAKELENPVEMTTKSLASRALGEGIEETSEEFLADAAKSMFNLSRYLRGEEGYDWGLENITWGDIKDRYALSFFGGALGGGLTSAFTDFKVNKSYSNMDHNQAMQELIWMIKNDEIDNFLKSVDKMTLFDKNLSSKMDEDGNMLPGTKTDNMDSEAKNMLRQQINLIKDALNVNGANISDGSFLDAMTLKDLRFAKLQNSVTAGKMLQAWNTLTARIADTQLRINAIKAGRQAENPDERIANGDKTDAQKRRDGEQNTQNNEQLQLLEKELADLVAYKDELLSGKHSAKFMEDVMFETTDTLSGLLIPTNFKEFAEKVTNKEFALIPEAELDRLQERYQVYVDNAKANDIEHASSFFMGMLQALSPLLKEDAKAYKTSAKDRFSQVFEEGSRQVFDTAENTEDQEEWNEAANQFISHEYGDLMQTVFGIYASKDTKDRLKAVLAKEVNDDYTEQDKNLEVSAIITNTFAKNVRPWLQHIVDSGYINPETKLALQRTLDRVLKLLEDDPAFSTDYDEHMQQGPLSSVTNYMAQYKSTSDAIKPNVFAQLSRYANTYGIDASDIDPLNTDLVERLADDVIKTHTQIINDLIAVRTDIKNLASTPLVQTLQKYLDKISPDNHIDLQEVMTQISNLLADNSSNTSNILLDNELSKKIDYLLKMFNWLGGVLVAAQVDNANLNDVWGYTKTINEINHKAGTENYEDLVELDSETATMMFQDLNLLRGRLLFMQNLHNINSGNKLQLQSRVGTKRDYLLLNKLEKFIVNVPDEYKGDAEPIIQAMSEENAPIYNKYKESHELSLSPEEKEAFTKEVIAIEDEINMFFQVAHPELLTNSDKLADFIAEIGIYDGKVTELNENTKDIDGHSFLWYLMSRAALKSSDWYGQYKSVISDKFAAIPSQESAIYFATACVLKGNIQKTFVEALLKAAIRDWTNTEKRPTEEERIRYRTAILNAINGPTGDFVKDEYAQYVINIPMFAQYKNIAFIEGIAGAGKTSLLNTAFELIKAIDPELVKGVFVVHGVSDKPTGDGTTSAEKLASRLTAAESTIPLDRNSLLQLLSGNKWSDEESLKKIGLEKTVEEQQVLRSLMEVDPNIANMPKIIIIDEIGRFNDIELDFIQKAAEMYGVTVITCGDLNQSVASGHINDAIKLVSSKDSSKFIDASLNLTIARAHIPHSFKLGVSMRETNDQLAKNEMIVRNAVMMNDRDEDNPDGIKLHSYFSEDTGLRGTVQVDNDPSQKDEVLKYVNDMIARLGEGERIGFIYDNENDWVFRLLSDDKYKDHIALYKGNSAQGDEHPYYIINLNLHKRINGATDSSISDKVRSDFLHDFYTAITRSENGNLLINSMTDFGDIDLKGGITTVMDDSSQSHPTSPEAIAKTSTERKKILDSVITDSNPLTYTERSKNTTTGVITTTSSPRPAAGNPAGTGAGVGRSTPSYPGSLAGKTNVTAINKNGIDYYIDGDTNKLYDADGKEITDQAVLDEVFGAPEPVTPKYADGTVLYDLDDKAYTVTSYDADKKQYNVQLEDGSETTLLESNLDMLRPAEEYEAQLVETMLQYSKDLIHNLGLILIDIETICNANGMDYSKYIDHDFIEEIGRTVNDAEKAKTITDVTVAITNLQLGIMNKAKAALAKAETDALNKQEDNNDDEVITTDNTLQDDTDDYVDAQNTTNSKKAQDLIDKTEDPEQKVPSLFYSQFALEINGSINDDGFFEYLDDDYEKRYAPRIDGVVGLLNLFDDRREEARTKIPFRTRGTRMGLQNAIGEITQIIFSPIDTAEKQMLIAQLLDDNFGLSSGVQKIDYFFKNQALPGDKAWFNDTDNPKYSRFDKHHDETIDCNTKDGIPVHRKQIVAVMTFVNGKKLEIPILKLASPITLCCYKKDGKYLYPKAAQFWNDRIGKLTEKGALNDAIDQFKTEFGGDPKYAGIINRFEIFTHNMGEVFQLQNFDPNTCLISTGVYYSEHKGEIDDIANITEQDKLDSGDFAEIEITKFINDPRLTVSKSIYSTKTGQVNSKQVTNPGHYFILASAVKYYEEGGQVFKFNSDQDLWNYYVKQCSDPNVPQLISIQYVMPPKATFEEYCDDMIKVVDADEKDRRSIQHIGNSTTIIDVFRRLMSTPEGQLFLKERVGHWISQADYDLIEKTVNEYNEIDRRLAGDRPKRIQQKMQYLSKRYDLPNAPGRVAHGNKVINSHLTSIFTAIVYPFTSTLEEGKPRRFKDINNINKISLLIGVNEIRMNVRFEGDEELKTITRPADDYALFGKPFTINSRTTTPVFAMANNSPFDFEKFVSAYVTDFTKHKRLKDSVRAKAERVYNSDLDGRKDGSNKEIWNDRKVKALIKQLNEAIIFGGLDKKLYNYNDNVNTVEEAVEKLQQLINQAVNDFNKSQDGQKLVVDNDGKLYTLTDDFFNRNQEIKHLDKNFYLVYDDDKMHLVRITKKTLSHIDLDKSLEEKLNEIYMQHEQDWSKTFNFINKNKDVLTQQPEVTDPNAITFTEAEVANFTTGFVDMLNAYVAAKEKLGQKSTFGSIVDNVTNVVTAMQSTGYEGFLDKLSAVPRFKVIKMSLVDKFDKLPQDVKDAISPFLNDETNKKILDELFKENERCSITIKN